MIRTRGERILSKRKIKIRGVQISAELAQKGKVMIKARGRGCPEVK